MHAVQTWRGWETTRKFRTFWEQALAGLGQVPVVRRGRAQVPEFPDVLLG